MRKRKILILLNSIQTGGLLISLLEALNVVQLNDFDITVYATSSFDSCEKRFPSEVKVIIDKDKTHYHRRPKAVLLHLKIVLFKLLKRTEKRKKYEEQLHSFVHAHKAKYPAEQYFCDGVDVVVSYALGLCTEMAVNIQADKKYLFFHSSDPSFHRDLTETCFGKFDRIIAVSKNVQQMLKQSFPEYKNKISLIRNYLNPDRIVFLSKEFSIDRFKKDIVLTSVVRVDKEKGADIIVDAALALKNKGFSFIWYIVGDGSDRALIEKQILDYGLSDYVFITGFQSNPYPYIKDCDIYVHPAYEESFGLAILEALILGKAVVSTDTMGAREVLENGEFGLIVSIDSFNIAEGIENLINNQNLKRKYEVSFQSNNKQERIVYEHEWTSLLKGEL